MNEDKIRETGLFCSENDAKKEKQMRLNMALMQRRIRQETIVYNKTMNKIFFVIILSFV